ncbi:5-oxoprolinase subunit PxpB [Ruminococcaceae bacterium OttesenSCG-928-A11]|nr:5-oxoprolinase subunit PxpB [Ruminococcaceae bacterium OttesenSCG-928-A11]
MGNRAKYRPVGDSALTMVFGDAIDPVVNARVLAMAQAVEQARLPGVGEVCPAYASLLVQYDPLTVDYRALVRLLKRLERAPGAGTAPAPRRLELPVLYGGPGGPDLGHVAGHTGLSPAEVIALHSGRDYPIYMIGFLPGFPYLGGMDGRLATPRLATPRVRIPPGSVGIAGGQTGVYPLPSPGGWQLVGRTPVRLYDPARPEPVPFRAGDFIRFVAVDEGRYDEIEEKVAREGWFPPPEEVAP